MLLVTTAMHCSVPEFTKIPSIVIGSSEVSWVVPESIGAVPELAFALSLSTSMGVGWGKGGCKIDSDCLLGLMDGLWRCSSATSEGISSLAEPSLEDRKSVV